MSAFIRSGLWTYRGHVLERWPLGACPPLNLRWVVRKPPSSNTIHRARTLQAARKWINTQVTP